MKRTLYFFLLLTSCFLEAKPMSFDLPRPGDFPPPRPKPIVVDSFYYMMAGAVVPASSMNLSHIFHPLPEISFGKRKVGLWHDWDYCVGARIGSNWEELYFQSSYLFRPIRNFGGYTGLGARLGGYHDKFKKDEEFRHAFGYYGEFLFHVGYAFYDKVPGFVQLQISSAGNAVIGYGFGF